MSSWGAKAQSRKAPLLIEGSRLRYFGQLFESENDCRIDAWLLSQGFGRKFLDCSLGSLGDSGMV